MKTKKAKKVMTPDGKTELVVGMGATYGIGSDAYPYTVVSFTESGNTIQVVRDDYTADKSPEAKYDYYSNQVYVYTQITPTPQNTETARWSKKRGCYLMKGSGRLSVGHRRAYSDPSF